MTYQSRSYEDVLRERNVKRPPVLHTRKQPGDWVQTHKGFVRIGEAA